MYDFDAIDSQVYARTTVNNLVGKYWAKFCQAHEVKMNMFSEEGDMNTYWLSLDDIIDATDGDLDETNLANYLLQPQFDDFDFKLEISDNYDSSVVAEGFGNEVLIQMTLGDLLSVFENDDMYKLHQFDVIPSRTASLLDKIVKAGRMYEPIELGYIDDIKNPVFLSGRHRATALLCLLSKVEGWEDLQIFVKAHQYSTCAELAAHIETRNGSRSMSSQERTNLWFATEGFDVADSSSVFDACKKGISVLPKVMNVYFVNSLQEEKENLGITDTTCGMLGQKIATKLKTHIPANLRKFLKDPEAAQAIADTCLDTVLTNWEGLKSLCEIKQVNSDGEQVITCNVSRNLDKIANPVAQEVADAFKTSLQNRQNELEAKKAQDKADRARKTKDNKKKKLLDSINYLKEAGLISDDQLKNFVTPDSQQPALV